MNTEHDSEAPDAEPVITEMRGTSIRFAPELNRAIKQGRFLAKETERGVLLVAAAMFEDQLRLTLLSFLAPGGTSEYLVGRRGPLASFGSRMDACYSLGLITLNELRWLKLIEELRNLCAHEWHLSDFSSIIAELKVQKRDVEHAERLAALEDTRTRIEGGDKPDGMRLAFEATVAHLMINMVYRPAKVAREKRTIREGTDWDAETPIPK
jgi:hypothetical protein